MQVILELTLYPLTRQYDEQILRFVEALRNYPDLDVRTGETATVIRGEYEMVFRMLEAECRKVLEQDVRSALVMKLLNTA
jgi:uncharacterized protein YqgV (UPF0045/DUF77 family)